jgi:hypothetical protein
MKQVVLAGLVAGAFVVGQVGLASAQGTSGSSSSGQAGGTTAGTGQAGSAAAGSTQTSGAKSGSAKGKASGAKEQGTAASGAMSLGSVRLTRAVKANGEPLAAGNYTVRLTAEEARPDAKGQDPKLERWVEFVQGSQVKGREVVSIVPESDIAQVAEGKRVPSGSSRVELLKGNDYVRVWINRGGNNYLIHLPPA